ncbi:MAG: hypothetical protein GFH27_549297n249 [Chloroflexi bacterium AL-W]|nr:hypothetical protein [Chloroflexi bacterium AL-N1]NOK68898.1 hypothetical protein [Chloroflexi bacterium AL-N10]NOK76881.1 hypothetical protein [Chloroflexi bacterium AL-N5]NOK82731.1 hypothetical protein [Chloroflexi bacterium AL-W]NOK90738.1 hypothetical protein [Chloroflexi bacterium AL-N15]
MASTSTSTNQSKRLWEDYKQLLSLSIPILLGSLAAIISGAIDTAMMGRTTTTALAGVAASAAIYIIASNIVVAATTGHQVLAPRRYGASEPQQVGTSFWHSLVIAGGLGLALMSLMLVTTSPLLLLVTQSPAVLQEAVGYLQVRAPGLLLIVPATLLRLTFNSNKETQWGMHASFITHGTNILFSYVLIFGWGPIPALGAVGNGIGSTLADFVGLLYLIWIAWRQNLFKHIRPATWKMEQHELRTLGKLSWPAMSSVVLDYGANLVLVGVMATLGASYLAGNRVAFNLLMIFFAATSSLAVGCLILSGRALGANNWESAHYYRRRNQEIMLIILCTLAFPIIIWPQGILMFYTSLSEVQAVTLDAIRLIGLSVPLMVWSSNNVAMLRALGHTKQDMYANIASVWLVQLPLGWLLATTFNWGLTGIYLGFMAYWLCRAILTQWMVRSAFNQVRSTLTEAQVS